MAISKLQTPIILFFFFLMLDLACQYSWVVFTTLAGTTVYTYLVEHYIPFGLLAVEIISELSMLKQYFALLSRIMLQLLALLFALLFPLQLISKNHYACPGIRHFPSPQSCVLNTRVPCAFAFGISATGLSVFKDNLDVPCT